MKKIKKNMVIFPEVHIQGDLQDVKTLVAGVNKKKTIVLFRDGEQETLYLEFDGKIRQIMQDDLNELKKDYRLIFFTFFPSQKKNIPPKEEKQAAEIPEKNPPPVKETKPKVEKRERKKEKKLSKRRTKK